MDVETKAAVATVEAIDSRDPNGVFDVILSTDALDRDGENLHPDEWKQPLPDRITFDSDHGMSVATTVGSGRPFINDHGQLQVRGTFASTPHAQTVRALVNEGHITTTSVAFKVHRDRKSDGVQRELLNGAFVAVPANPEAVVLSSKADKPKPLTPGSNYADPGWQPDKKPRYPLDTEAHARSAWSYINMPKNASAYSPEQLSKIKSKIKSALRKFGVEISDDGKWFMDAVTKQQDTSGNALQDRLQAIHDYAVDLGAMCNEEQTEPSDNPKEESAEKSVAETPTVKGGSPMESAEESAAPAAATVKAVAAAGAADESAESVALRARALALSLNTTGVQHYGDWC
jgi:hypothetical protein